GTASGNEDTAIALDISAALVDTDLSESLSIAITGVPAGASPNHGSYDSLTDTWTLTSAQLSGLTITPAANSDADFTLNVTATSTEAGPSAPGLGTASTSGAIAVAVAAVADSPHLDLNSGTGGDQHSGTASGNEDTAIALDISAALVDTDLSESLSIAITGVPAGASPNHGSYDSLTDTWTLTSAQLSGLTITPAANSDADFTLNVTATSTEAGPSAPGLGTASTSGAIAVAVAAVADSPHLDLNSGTGCDQHGGTACGNEDTAIALDISAALVDTDLSESLSIAITGVPAGASLNHGSYDSLTDTWTLTSAQLAGLTITPAANSDADFTLNVTATSTEAGPSAPGLGTASTSATIAVTVAAVADAPHLDLNSGTGGDQHSGTASGNEDTAIALDISAALVDTDLSESLSIAITGVPAGASLNHGSYDSLTDTWTLTSAQLAGLTITPAANSDADFTLNVTATSTEAGPSAPGLGTASTSATIAVTVAAVADAPHLDLNSGTGGDQHSGTASGNEDTAIALDISAALVDTDLSESLSIAITGVPAGASLNHGSYDSLTDTWTLTSAQLSGLTITPAANSDADFTLNVTATSTEAGPSAHGLGTASTSGTIAVTVAAVADAPHLDLNSGTGGDQHSGTAPGTEDAAIALDSSAARVDADLWESLSIAITGVPAGASLNHGSYDSLTDTWTLTSAQLSGLTITPAANSDADFTLNVTATSTEAGPSAPGLGTASTSGTIAVTVAAVSDAPHLDLNSGTGGDQHSGTASGNEDTAIALDISAALVDTD